MAAGQLHHPVLRIGDALGPGEDVLHLHEVVVAQHHEGRNADLPQPLVGKLQPAGRALAGDAHECLPNQLR